MNETNDAKRILERALEFYCDWYDNEKPYQPENVAYELATFIRRALVAL